MEKMKNYLAKSDGTLLLDHLNNTAEIAEIYVGIVYPILNEIVDDPLENKRRENYKNIIRYSCLLHDVLKILPNFQEYIKGDIEPESQKYYHNEIGWAFLDSAIDIDKLDLDFNLIDKDDAKNLIIDSIFYHHGNKLNNISKSDIKSIDILEYADILDNNDLIDEIYSFIKNELNLDILKNFKVKNSNLPLLYNRTDIKNNNYSSDLILVRDVLIVSDRLSSEYPNKDIFIYPIIINEIINKKRQYAITEETLSKNPNFNIEIFNEHKNIANNLRKSTTIKAPAGYGKTMVGLLSGFNTNRKLVWVCSTKQVVDSVYDTILEYSNDLNLNMNIQSIYTGQVINSTKSTELFDADIIVVNIDMFLSTTYRNNYKFSMILSSGFVVFDEYHESTIEAALFPVSVLVINHRINFCNNKTLLLSATPIPHFIEKSLFKDHIILPNELNHYKPRHDKKYKFNFINDFNKINPDISTICFTGTVKNTIKEFLSNKNKNKKIIHSEFYSDYKKEFTDELKLNFGTKKTDKPNIKLFTTSLLESSINISFNNCAINIISPENTLQSIGRCNRFGESNDATVYLMYTNDDKSHAALVDKKFNINITHKWYKFLKENLISEEGFTLKDLYNLYNEFNENNKLTIRQYYFNKLNQSLKYCENINIKRLNLNIDDNSPIYANSNKLRYTNTEIFYITKETDGDYMLEPFTKETFGDPFKTFGINKDKYINSKENLKNIMERLTQSDIYDYDYSDILKKMKRESYQGYDLINDLGNTNKTPLILMPNNSNKIYDKMVGMKNIKW
jgi:CRISPR-associated endonuclease Cas3-HD